MPIDETLVQEALAVRERCGELELQLAQGKADFCRAVRRLHASGASLREIAERLELSHQRVHQLVAEGGTGGWIARLTGGRRLPAQGEPAHCSFCRASRPDVRRLIAGPGVRICDRCVGAATRVATGESPAPDDTGPFGLVPAAEGRARCNFCGRGPRRVRCIVRGGAAASSICDGCLELCRQVVAETPGQSG